MYRNKKLINFLLSISAFLLLVYCIFLYYSMGDRPWIFYNSDSIYLPYLYSDLFFRQGSVYQWMFSPVPYFFPDTLLYFILAAITHDLRVSILLFAGVQFALYYVLIVAIGSEILVRRQKNLIFHLSVLISLALVALGYLQQETLNLGLISQSHFGTALMFLFGLFLILKTFSSNKKIYYIFLFLLCFFTTFSDVLFITQFIGVALISLCLMLFFAANDNQRRIYTTNIFVITIATTLSYIVYQHSFFWLNMTLNTHFIRRHTISDLLLAAERIYQNFLLFYQQNPFVVFLLLLFLMLSLWLIIKIIYNRINQSPVLFESKFSFTIIMLLGSVLASIVSLLFFDNNLMVPGYYGMRHCLPMVLFPVFLGIPLYLARYTRLDEVLSKYYLILVVLIVGGVYLLAPHGSIGNILRFYPSSVACLDAIAEKFTLKDGITDFYWVSRSYSFLSKRGLNVVVVAGMNKNDFVPRRWFNTLNDYIGKDFRYYITDIGHLVDTDHFQPINNKIIRDQIGPPQARFICPSWETGKFDHIYVYNPGKINVDLNYEGKV